MIERLFASALGLALVVGCGDGDDAGADAAADVTDSVDSAAPETGTAAETDVAEVEPADGDVAEDTEPVEESTDARDSTQPPSDRVAANEHGGFDISPSTRSSDTERAREDTDNWTWVLAHTSPGGLIRCDAGEFLIDHVVYGANVQAKIRCAGSDRTVIRAFAPPGGVFQTGSSPYAPGEEPPPAEMLNLGVATETDTVYPSLFLFTESDTDLAGEPTTARSTNIGISGVTFSVSGLTDALDLGGGAGQLLGYVQVLGKDYRWIEPTLALSEDGSALAPGWELSTSIDGPDADGPRVNELSHAELHLSDVVFDGRNAVADAPSARGGVFMMGGTEFGDSGLFHKPLNGVLTMDRCVFRELRVGFNLPAAVSPGETDWAFPEDATQSSALISNSVFDAVRFAFFFDEPGGALVVFKDNTVTPTASGPSSSGGWFSGCLGHTWWPPARSASELILIGNSFTIADGAGGVWIEECAAGASTVSATIRGNEFTVSGEGSMAITGLQASDALVIDNTYSGSGAAAISATSGESWTIIETGLDGFSGDTSDVLLNGTRDSFVYAPRATVSDTGENNVILP